jgi:hypothetical protein
MTHLPPTDITPGDSTLPWIALRLRNHASAPEEAVYPELRIHANASGFRKLAKVFEEFAEVCDAQDSAPTPHGSSVTTSVTIEPGEPTSTAGPAVRELLSDRVTLRLLHLPEFERQSWIKTWCAGLGDHRCLTIRYPELVARAKSTLEALGHTPSGDGDSTDRFLPFLLSPAEALERIRREGTELRPLHGLELLHDDRGTLRLEGSYTLPDSDPAEAWRQAVTFLESIREQPAVVAFVPQRSTPT